jgi:hypothetical protein
MTPLEKLGEMFMKVGDMFGSLLGRNLNLKNRLVGNEWEVATEALIMGKNKTNCDDLAHQIVNGTVKLCICKNNKFGCIKVCWISQKVLAVESWRS